MVNEDAKIGVFGSKAGITCSEAIRKNDIKMCHKIQRESTCKSFVVC